MIIDVVKYNLLREALVSDASQEHDVVRVRPKMFALKKMHTEEVLTAAMELLEDPRVVRGITPLESLDTFGDEITPEIGLYVLMCYAVAVQQGWLMYSSITDRYYVDLKNQDARQYVEDTHRVKLN